MKKRILAAALALMMVLGISPQTAFATEQTTLSAIDVVTPPAVEVATPPAVEVTTPPAAEVATPPAVEVATPPAVEVATPPAVELPTLTTAQILQQVYSTGEGTRAEPHLIENYAQFKEVLENGDDKVYRILESIDIHDVMIDEVSTINEYAIITVNGNKTLIIDAYVELMPSFDRNTTPNYFFHLDNNDSLTLEGSRSLVLGGAESNRQNSLFSAFYLTDNAKLTVNSGDYTLAENYRSGSYTPRLIERDSPSAKLEINGGRFDVNRVGLSTEVAAIFWNDAGNTSGNILINGGVFEADYSTIFYVDESSPSTYFAIRKANLHLYDGGTIDRGYESNVSDGVFYSDFVDVNSYYDFNHEPGEYYEVIIDPLGSSKPKSTKENPIIITSKEDFEGLFNNIPDKEVYIKIVPTASEGKIWSFNHSLGTIPQNRTLHMDLNGYTVQMSDWEHDAESGYDSQLTITDGAHLIIEDSSADKTGEFFANYEQRNYGDAHSCTHGMIEVSDGGKLTINSGFFRMTTALGSYHHEKYSQTPSIIKVFDGATVDINGGTFQTDRDNKQAEAQVTDDNAWRSDNMPACIEVVNTTENNSVININNATFTSRNFNLTDQGIGHALRILHKGDTQTFGDYEIIIEDSSFYGHTTAIAYGQHKYDAYGFVSVDLREIQKSYQGTSDALHESLSGNIEIGGAVVVNSNLTSQEVVGDIIADPEPSATLNVTLTHNVESGTTQEDRQKVSTEMETTKTLSTQHTSATGDVTYQWYKADNRDYYTGVPVTGATEKQYTPPTDYHGVSYYYLAVTHTEGGNHYPTVSYSPIVTFTVTKYHQAAPTIGTTTASDFSTEHDLSVYDNSSIWVKNRTNKPMLFERYISRGDDITVQPGASAVITGVAGSVDWNNDKIYDINISFPETVTHARSESAAIPLSKTTSAAVNDQMTISAAPETVLNGGNGSITVTPKFGKTFGTYGNDTDHWQIKYRKVGDSDWEELRANGTTPLTASNLAPGSYEVIARRENGGSYFLFSDPITVVVAPYELNASTAYGTFTLQGAINGVTDKIYYLSPTSNTTNPSLPSGFSWDFTTSTITLENVNNKTAGTDFYQRTIKFGYGNARLHLKGDNVIAQSTADPGIEAVGNLTITAETGLSPSERGELVFDTGVEDANTAIKVGGNLEILDSKIDIDMLKSNKTAIYADGNISFLYGTLLDINYGTISVSSSAQYAIHSNDGTVTFASSNSTDVKAPRTNQADKAVKADKIEIVGSGSCSFYANSLSAADNVAVFLEGDVVYNPAAHEQKIVFTEVEGYSHRLIYQAVYDAGSDITSVTIGGYDGILTSGLNPRASYELTATVNGTNATNSQAVVWTVTGAHSNLTEIEIGENGSALLKVGTDETARKITVTATSALNNDVSAIREFDVSVATPISGTVTLDNMSPKGGDTIGVNTNGAVYSGTLSYRWQYSQDGNNPYVNEISGEKNSQFYISEEYMNEYVRVVITSDSNSDVLYSPWTNQITQLGAAPPKPSGLVAYAPQVAGGNGGITGLTIDMEYKKSTEPDTSYKSIFTNDIKNDIFPNSGIKGLKLEAGITYNIRYEKGEREASQPTSVLVPIYVAPTNISIHFPNDEIFVDKSEPYGSLIAWVNIDVIVSGDTDDNALIDQSVTWEIDGKAVPSDGTISLSYNASSGRSLMQIYNPFDKTRFTITATSTLDPTKSATATVYFGSMGKLYARIEGKEHGEELTVTLHKPVTNVPPAEGELFVSNVATGEVVTNTTVTNNHFNVYAPDGTYDVKISVAGYDDILYEDIVLTADTTTYLNNVRLSKGKLGDLDGDDFVTVKDLAIIAAPDNYNKLTTGSDPATNSKADLNGDGTVNFADLAMARNSKNFG